MTSESANPSREGTPRPDKIVATQAACRGGMNITLIATTALVCLSIVGVLALAYWLRG